MTTLREILDKRREDAKPLMYGPRKGRPWGRLQRRNYRLEQGSVEPGPVYGYMLHYKNAAARRKYRAGLDAIMTTGVEGDALKAAVEDLQNHFCKIVTLYAGLDRRLRRQMRSEMAREDRNYEAERNIGDSESSPADDPAGADAGV